MKILMIFALCVSLILSGFAQDVHITNADAAQAASVSSTVCLSGGKPFTVKRYGLSELQRAGYEAVDDKILSNGDNERRTEVLTKKVPMPEIIDKGSLNGILGQVVLAQASYAFPVYMQRPGGYRRTAVMAGAACYGRLLGWKIFEGPTYTEVDLCLSYVGHEKCANRYKGLWKYYSTFSIPTAPRSRTALQPGKIQVEYQDRLVYVERDTQTTITQPPSEPIIYTPIIGRGLMVTEGVQQQAIVTGSVGVWKEWYRSSGSSFTSPAICSGSPPVLPPAPITLPAAPSTPPNDPTTEGTRPDPNIPNPSPTGSGSPGPSNGGSPITVNANG